MPVVIAIGVQWGDEGKGKVVDYITEKADIIVRFQGGNNAGHTVIAEGRKTALHLIPSGILRKGTRCLLASGVVLEPNSLFTEFEKLAEAGIEVTPKRFGIAGEVQLILPYHIAIDQAREAAAAKGKIGTTGKGIGPAYEDAVSRFGIRIADLFNESHLEQLVSRNVAIKNNVLQAVLNSPIRFHEEEVLSELAKCRKRLEPYVTDVSLEVRDAISANKLVIFEGAQGALLDINLGTYPFVTSSNTTAGYACVSAGFGPKSVDMIIGICKAYSTRVGSGPFPTEDDGKDGEVMRSVGAEFGTTTGRPRRCGWFDGVAVKRTVAVNGIDSIILTKLDVLSGFQKVRIATGYILDDKKIEDFPFTAQELERVVPVYQELPGWKEDITGVRSFEQLPVTAQEFIAKIEAEVGCRVGGFSVGPDREQTIVRDPQLRQFTMV